MTFFKSFCSLIHKATNYDAVSSNTACLKPLSAKYLLSAAMSTKSAFMTHVI